MSMAESIRVLYIEDDLGLARLLQKRLARIGFEVDTVNSGSEGIVRLENETYDVLLVDYEMPAYSGLDVIRTLASRDRLPATVMITGHGNEGVAVEAMKLGAADYVIKDAHMVYLELLPYTIERVFQQQRLDREKTRLFDALQEREERYRLLVELSPDGIAVVGEQKFVFINPAGVALLGGRQGDDILGRSFYEVVVEAQQASVREQLQAARLGQKTAWMSIDFIRLDGTIVHVEMAGVPFIYERKPAFQIIFRDLSDRPLETT